MFMLHDGVEISFRVHSFLNCASEAFKATKRLQLFFAEIAFTQIQPVAIAPSTDTFRAFATRVSMNRAPDEWRDCAFGAALCGKALPYRRSTFNLFPEAQPQK